MRFIVSISFNTQEFEEITPLISKEQAHIKELMQKKLVEAIYISADRSKVWIVMPGDSDTDIQERIQDFPLYPYMHTEITQLV